MVETIQQIINGGVGYATGLPGNESQFDIKAHGKSALRNHNRSHEKLERAIDSDINACEPYLINQDSAVLEGISETATPIYSQEILASLEGISKAAISVPNTVAPQELIQTGATVPPHTQTVDHFKLYNNATDFQELDIKQSNHLKFLLLQETGVLDDYIVDQKEQVAELENKRSEYTPMNLMQYLRR